jgi:carbon-monoxide dehydrogenase medium subunit
MKKFDYLQPKTLLEAFSLMTGAKEAARYVAGGTDLIVHIKEGAIQPDALISLRGIQGLRGIEHNGALSIGGMTPLRDIERNAVIRDRYPALAEAVSVLANPQIRNVATLAGNLCNAAPSADCAPPLLAMEAVLTLEGPRGRREIPIGAFFRGPGDTLMKPEEILTRIRIPQSHDEAATAFLKLGRVAQDIATVNAAALLVMEDGKCRKCRLAVGAVAPIPLRLEKVERMAEGGAIDQELLGRVAHMVEQEVTPITDIRSTSEYRRVMSGVLVKRAIEAALGRLG